MGIVSIFLVISFLAIEEASRIFTLLFPYLADLAVNLLDHYAKNGTVITEKRLFLLTVLSVNGTWLFAYLLRILLLHFS